MADDPIEARRIIGEFKKRRGRQLTVTVLFLIAMLPCGLLQEFTGIDPLELSAGTYRGLYAAAILGICAVAVAGIVAFTLSNWRCPACHGYLGNRFDPTFCPKCGMRLQ